MTIKLSPVCFLLVFASVVWSRNRGLEYRLCFKDIKNGTCKYESFVGEWEFKRNEDCCNSNGAAYYINVTEEDRIIFHVLKVGQRPCAPCKKAGWTVNSSFVNPPSCETTKCRYGKVCKIRYGKPKCLCPSCHTPDLKRHQPVCGTDGNTYNNECEFRRMTCKNGGLSNVEIDYEGSCQTGCDNVVCRKNRTCVVDVYNVPSCVSCEALYNSKSNFTRHDPICGADGVQYQNDDHLRLESCKQGKTIGVAYKGNCVVNATCQKISCPKEDVQRDIRGNIYSVRRHCVYDNNNKPRCISCTCKESFPGSVKPSSELCGTDNMTYPSYCALKEKMCSGNTFLDIQYRGRCRDSDRINDDPAKQSLITTPKPCKYEELDNYYITQRELASVLKKHFGLEVRKKPLGDKKIIMERLIHFLRRKWSKILVKTGDQS